MPKFCDIVKSLTAEMTWGETGYIQAKANGQRPSKVAVRALTSIDYSVRRYF